MILQFWECVSCICGWYLLFIGSIIFILTEAVRRNACGVRATDASLEKDVQKWLRQACDRDGGRQERFKKNLSSLKSVKNNLAAGSEMTSQLALVADSEAIVADSNESS